MSQIYEYITSLNWADNWFIYIIASILVLWLGILTIKYIFNKVVYIVKKLLITSAILSVLTALTYVLFLLGVVELDILNLIGLGGVSNSIQSFIGGMQEWFRVTFSLTATLVNFIK